MVYKQDPELIFNEEEHTYYKNGIKYVGVNELLKKYIPEFDTSIVKYLAGKGKYENMSEQQILTKWDDAKTKSIIRGKHIHYIAELIIKNKLKELQDFLKLNPQYEKEYKLIKEFLYENGLTDNDQAEIIVSNDEYRIAGTIDFLGYYNGELCIIDWKTNEDISTKAYGTFEEPFNMFDNNTFNKYVFQLNIYMHILKLSGIDVKHLYLAHIKDDVIVMYKLPKIVSDIKLLFNERKEELNKMKIQTKKPKREFNAMRFGMCCNQVNDLIVNDKILEIARETRIKYLYFLYEELEQEIKNEIKN